MSRLTREQRLTQSFGAESTEAEAQAIDEAAPVNYDDPATQAAILHPKPIEVELVFEDARKPRKIELPVEWTPDMVGRRRLQDDLYSINLLLMSIIERRTGQQAVADREWISKNEATWSYAAMHPDVLEQSRSFLARLAGVAVRDIEDGMSSENVAGCVIAILTVRYAKLKNAPTGKVAPA